MRPRERDVVRAIAKALRGNPTDMDAYATSYELPREYAAGNIRQRAAIFLDELAK